MVGCWLLLIALDETLSEQAYGLASFWLVRSGCRCRESADDVERIAVARRPDSPLTTPSDPAQEMRREPLIIPFDYQRASLRVSCCLSALLVLLRSVLRSRSLFAKVGEQITGCKRWELLVWTAGQMDG